MTVTAELEERGGNIKNKLLCIFFACALLTGCDEELGEPEISITDITPKNGFHYALAEDCGGGYIFKSGNTMWYYDYKYGKSVPFCSDPACKHNDKQCAAYLPCRVFGYKDKFVIAGNEMNWESDSCVDDGIFVLEEMLPGERTKREITRINNRRWCDTFAYGDKLYIGLDEEYYLDGDYIYASSDRIRVYFMVVSLDTLEVEFMSDCLTDAFTTDMSFRGVNGGKMYFDIYYYTETGLGIFFGDYDPETYEPPDRERFVKHMVYDTKTKELSELTVQAERYFDGCAVYYDGKNIAIDRGDKICRLESDYELPYCPMIALQYCSGKVYFDGNAPDTLCIYDTETEKLISVYYTGLNGLRFVTERENELVFSRVGSSTSEKGNGDETVILSKDKCVISEVTPERYNELRKADYDSYREFIESEEETQNAHAE